MSMPYRGPDLSYAQGAWRPQGWEHFGIVNGSRANVGWAVGSYYHWQVDRLRQAGCEVGHYFFIGNVDAVAAADFFVNNLYDFRVGDSLWLDMEPEGGTGTVVWSPAKCLAFCLRVFQRTGVMPGIYLNKSLENGYDWSALVAAGVRLWSAYYQGGALPSVRNWSEVSMLQYTSTPIDTNAAAYTQAEMAGAAAPKKEKKMAGKLSQIRATEDGSTNTDQLYWERADGSLVWIQDSNDLALLQRYQVASDGDKFDHFYPAEIDRLNSLYFVPPASPIDPTAVATAIATAVQSALAGTKIQIDSANLADNILDAASERRFFTK